MLLYYNTCSALSTHIALYSVGCGLSVLGSIECIHHTASCCIRLTVSKKFFSSLIIVLSPLVYAEWASLINRLADNIHVRQIRSAIQPAKRSYGNINEYQNVHCILQ